MSYDGMSYDGMSTKEIAAKVAATRLELRETLDGIENAFNVPRQLGRLGAWAKKSWRENPVPWAATAATVAVGIVSVGVWAILSRDD